MYSYAKEDKEIVSKICRGLYNSAIKNKVGIKISEACIYLGMTLDEAINALAVIPNSEWKLEKEEEEYYDSQTNTTFYEEIPDCIVATHSDFAVPNSILFELGSNNVITGIYTYRNYSLPEEWLLTDTEAENREFWMELIYDDLFDKPDCISSGRVSKEKYNGYSIGYGGRRHYLKDLQLSGISLVPPKRIDDAEKILVDSGFDFSNTSLPNKTYKYFDIMPERQRNEETTYVTRKYVPGKFTIENGERKYVEGYSVCTPYEPKTDNMNVF